MNGGRYRLLNDGVKVKRIMRLLALFVVAGSFVEVVEDTVVSSGIVVVIVVSSMIDDNVVVTASNIKN